MKTSELFIHHPGVTTAPAGYSNLEPIILSDADEFRVCQFMLEELRHIIKIAAQVLIDQDKYWVNIHPLKCPEQKSRIKQVIENHRRTPLEWIGDGRIEITINPEKRIKKKRL